MKTYWAKSIENQGLARGKIILPCDKIAAVSSLQVQIQPAQLRFLVHRLQEEADRAKAVVA